LTNLSLTIKKEPSYKNEQLLTDGIKYKFIQSSKDFKHFSKMVTMNLHFDPLQMEVDRMNERID
jgi:hypothetical protein